MIYSYSRLKRYADCPASFQYKYLYEMPELPTEPLVLGKTVHTAIQLYLTGTELQNAVDQAILQEAELPVDRDEVLRLVEHPMVRKIQSGQVEQQFLIPLDREGVIQLQGYIDWYEQLPSGAVKLIDWKSNRQKYAPTDNHQLGLYSWYLSQVTGATEVDAELLFLRYPYADSRQAYTYTSVEMEEARKWALTLATEIEDKVAELNLLDGGDDVNLFPAIPGKHCQTCSHASLCIKSVQINPVKIDDEVDAQRVAAEVIRLESATSEMKEHLKAWAKEHGAIAVGDSSFEFVPSISWNIDAEKLYELCSELHDRGLDVFQYLTLTAANLKKMGVTDAQLQLYGKQKTTKTFRLVKAKEAC
ncbi:PD-(D/E)XK nuclease family protein [Anaerosinus sp.]|uniref:PD-(D/E)XK nuclease family protein n=1 Tax=Selenobaculum sp. TaxID=3074374 RepID=UPI003AB662CD